MKKFILSQLLIAGLNEAKFTSAEEREQVKSSTEEEFQKRFGDDWDIIPLTSIQSLVAVFILNKALVPYGVTPRKIAELALSKASDFGFDDMASSFLEDVKSTGEFSKEKFKDVVEFAGDTGKSTIGVLDDLFVVSTDYAKRTLQSGTKKISSIFSKNQKSDKDQD